MTKKSPSNEFVGIRVKRETKKQLEKHLQNANKKTLGRKVKMDEVIQKAISLVTDEVVKELQINSLSNEDRKEQLRQIYVKEKGQITKDDFTGFMLAPGFQDFLESHKDLYKNT